MTNGDERRKHGRIPVNKPFLIRFGDARKLRRIYVRDISKGGLFVRTSQPREKGAPVRVILELPDGTRFPLDGEVVYARGPEYGPSGTGNGIQFTSLNKNVRNLLEQYMDQHDPPPSATMTAPGAAPTPPSAAAAEVAPAPAAAAPAPAPAADKPARVPLPGLIDEPEPAPAEPSIGTLLLLEEHLAEFEKHIRGNAYEILGIEPHAGEADIRDAHAERLSELDLARYSGSLPEHMRQRVRRALSRMESAVEILLSPRSRAALDLEMNLLLPPCSSQEVIVAFREELAARRASASEAQRADFERAGPYITSGTERLEARQLHEAASLLRVALLFDPFNVELRQKLAWAEGAAT